MTGAPPKVFISYSHDTLRHQERVLGLADRLRADGIDAEIDQYNAAPPEGWPLWCERQIAAADVVLMVCTETYHRRVSGEEEQGKGLGVVWEARIIRQLLYDAGGISDKFVPVLFSDASPEQIPTPIKGWTRYVVDTEDGYEELYRRLTGQPHLLRPALGKIRPLPTRTRQWPESMMAALNPRAIQKTANGRGQMEPVSAIVGALSAGAAALASGALSEAGKDAYNRLRGAILRVVSSADLEKLEKKPELENRKGVLAKELAEAGKAEDSELAELAAELAQHTIAALKASGAAVTTGIILEDVEAINLRLQRITASGPGVKGKKLRLAGDLEIRDVDAGVVPGKSIRRQD